MRPPASGPAETVRAELRDDFWAPRQVQHAEHTLAVLLDRLESHGVVDNFRRLTGRARASHAGLWFTDSDLYKWMEAAACAGRFDLLDPVVDDVVAAQHPDGYLHSFYGTRTAVGQQPRWGDLAVSHEMYCAGHFLEAALAHEGASGSSVMLEAAVRLAEHLCATFGPGTGLDHRVDNHPEIELAMARLGARTGERRYLDFARWAVLAQLHGAGLSIDTVDLSGHAVRALYLASAIAEVALATGDHEWVDSAARLFDTMVMQRSYPTGAVGGRWLGEAVGQPYELPEAMAYAESCAAVAATQFSDRIWRLTADTRSLEQIETLLYNAVPCGVGAGGDTWFYSQPQAVGPDAIETNPWLEAFDFGQLMLLDWFPPRRHGWFDVTCCPPNLARLFATVDRYVAEVSSTGDLLIHLPVAARLTGGGWDVEVSSSYPDSGAVKIRVLSGPLGRAVRVRRPRWATRSPSGGTPAGDADAVHVVVGDGESLDLSFEPAWWETDPRVEGAAGTVFLRCGPRLHCVEGIDAPGIDLRLLTVDPIQPLDSAFALVVVPSGSGLHGPLGSSPVFEPVHVATIPYHAWGNRGATSMRMRFRRR